MNRPSRPKIPLKVGTPRRGVRCGVIRQWLDEVAAGTEKSIRDTHAWKDMVRRVGLKEARRILRLGLLASKLPDSTPLN
jgi:pilus assembly protein TadC